MSAKIIVLIIILLIFAAVDGAFLGKLLFENKTLEDGLTTINIPIISQPIQDKGDNLKTTAVHDLEQSSLTQR